LLLLFSPAGHQREWDEKDGGWGLGLGIGFWAQLSPFEFCLRNDKKIGCGWSLWHVLLMVMMMVMMMMPLLQNRSTCGELMATFGGGLGTDGFHWKM
jgi:hypothetical protein